MLTSSPPDDAPGPSESKASTESRRLSNGGSHIEDDPLSNGEPSQSSAEIGIETVLEPEPAIHTDEVALLS